MYDVNWLQSELGGMFHVEHLDLIDSTNEALKREIKKRDITLLSQNSPPIPLHELSPKLLLATEQTQGRGQHQRSWLSQRGRTVMMSFLMPIANANAIPLSQLPYQLATVLRQCCQDTFPNLAVEPTFIVKPPNDLYLNGQKLAGILVESIQRGASQALIIGCGFNAFPMDAAAHSTAHLPHAALLSAEQMAHNRQLMPKVIHQLIVSFAQAIYRLITLYPAAHESTT